MSWNNHIKVLKNISKIDVNILGHGVALYVRVTREESIKQGLSIPNQCSRGLEVAANREWNWVKIYVEPRHIGAEFWTDKRPALAELIKDIKSGKIKRVFARHQDRLWRSSEIRDRLLGVFKKYEVELWDFDGFKDYKTASGKFALKVQADASEYEKDITSERIREMKRCKAMSGRCSGGPPPYGYTSQTRVKRELVKNEGLNDEDAYQKACEAIPNKKEWYIHPLEAEALILIISLYLSKHPSFVISSVCRERFQSGTISKIYRIFQNAKIPMGSRRIAELLNVQGYRNMNSNPWNGSKVLRIIDNPAAFGYVTYDEAAYQKRQPSNLAKKDCKFFQSIHEPIVNPELWKEAQAIKSRNAAYLRTRSRKGRIYPLSKLIFCGKCHSSMRAMSQGWNRPFAYYVCRNRSYYGADIKNNPRACDFPRINVQYAEDSVWKNLLPLAYCPPDILASLEAIKAQRQKQLPLLKNEYERMRKEQTELRGLIQKYHSRFEVSKNAVEEDLAWQKLVELKARQNELNQKEDHLKQELSKKAMARPEKLIHQQLEKLKTLISKIKNRRLLYQALNEKYYFRVIAHHRYLLEPMIEIHLFRADEHNNGHSIKLSKQLDIQPLDQKPLKEWIGREQGKHRCACGCGDFIQIRPQHRTKGIPRYKFGHHTFPLKNRFDQYSQRGFYSIGQISKMLGIGHSTIRRNLGRSFPDAELIVNRNKMRLFSKDQIETMRQVLAQRRGQFNSPLPV